MPPVPEGKTPFALDLAPLDGDMTKAAKNLRNALRDMVQYHGLTATVAKLGAIVTANTPGGN